MARKTASRRTSARASQRQRIRLPLTRSSAKSPPAHRSKLASVVSALKSTIRRAAARSVKRSQVTASRTSGGSAAQNLPKRPPPIKRTSVVRKPARGPSRRSATQRTVPSRMKQAGAATTSQTASTSASTAPIGTVQSRGTPSDYSSASQTPPSISSPTQAHRFAEIERRFSIPTGYGDDRIILMVKDPWWLYAYWEIQSSTERAARSQLLPQEVAGLQTVLRVHDVTGIEFPAQSALRSFDISLSGLATNWYIHTNAPNSSFIVDIGILTNTGRFLLLARSNRVTTPRAGPSEIVDEAWMVSDEAYTKLFGSAVGLGMGSSPSGWAHFLSQQLFSGGWASPALAGARQQPAVRGFWYRIETDLVIHGATEPRSAVRVQGQAVPVRKDGTFSLRFALPAGTQTITIDITSPDGQHTHTRSPVVSLSGIGALVPDVMKTSERKLRSPSRSHDGGEVPS